MNEYVEQIQPKNVKVIGEQIDLQTENTADINSTQFFLKSILRLLKPLTVTSNTGGGINRLLVDVGTAATVTTVTNASRVGNVEGHALQQSLFRNAFANGIRKNLV